MNKAELVTAIAEKTGQSQSTVGDVLGAFEAVVTDQVVSGNKVQIPASTVPKVKIGKSFKDAVGK